MRRDFFEVTVEMMISLCHELADPGIVVHENISCFDVGDSAGARSLAVSDLRSETKGSRFESGC